ncbi:MAG: alginate lyase family protein [Verrucomicrobia bacterium]|nr:alginate lyase family protein [Verrucomicrobiota bacterium]
MYVYLAGRTRLIVFSVIAFFLSIVGVVQAQSFVHPGILHTRADLERIREKTAAGAQPWERGFEVLRAHPQSSSEYKVRGGFSEMGRKPNVHTIEIRNDCNAAYQNALVWAITGDRAHADKAIEILNAWSSTLEEISGKDAILAASLFGDKLVNAAEILRYTDAGWAGSDVARCEDMFRDVFYPEIRDFATFANGNWGTGCVKTMMAIGVFCDDEAIFDRAVNWYCAGAGNGCLTNYIINETGQCQESGRDQQHVQLGLGHLAEAAEIGWNQGLDLYSAADNRLLCGFEYTAAYNLGKEVPFQEHLDTTGKYHHTRISDKGRGRFRPIYEMVFNHYVKRRGIPAPNTERVVERIRPEGAGFNADHPGFGTLLFAR